MSQFYHVIWSWKWDEFSARHKEEITVLLLCSSLFNLQIAVRLSVIGRRSFKSCNFTLRLICFSYNHSVPVVRRFDLVNQSLLQASVRWSIHFCYWHSLYFTCLGVPSALQVFTYRNKYAFNLKLKHDSRANRSYFKRKKISRWNWSKFLDVKILKMR